MINSGEDLRRTVESEMRKLVKNYREEHGVNEAKKIARDEYLAELFDKATKTDDTTARWCMLKILMVMNLRTW